jgi:hypothetical protein
MPAQTATGSPSSSARLHRTFAIEVRLFLLLSLCYLWPIDLDPGANVLAHIDQAAAIVEHHTLSIDAFLEPPDGPNTVDWSRGRDGRFYPAKAPGASLAAVPVLAVLHRAESAMGIRPFKGDWLRRNLVLVNWMMNSLVSALAMTVLFRIVVALGFSSSDALLSVLAIALGTAYYPYATTYAAHNPAANLLIGAAYFVFVAPPSRRGDVLVGLLSGFAVTFDYAATFGVLVFAAVFAMTRPRALMLFAAGGLLPLSILVCYHTAVFGGPTITAYRSMNPRISPSDGVLLRVPEFDTLLTLTISPYRGLFFYSPVLVIAAVGAWYWFAGRLPWHELGRRPGPWRLAVGSGLALFLLWFLFNACYYIWWGGWTAGSRYIIPGLVLLAPSIAAGFRTVPRIVGIGLLALSIANQFAISTVVVMVNDDILNPLADVIYPFLIQGHFQRSNLGMFAFHLAGLWSLVPLLIPAAALTYSLVRRVAIES